MEARTDYRKVLKWGAIVVVGLAILVSAAAYAMIEFGLYSAGKKAQLRFPGRDTAAALIEVADCAKCPMEERNLAVWALGQMREDRALPVLHKHYNGGRCDHSKELCQYELSKALKRIEANPPVQAKR
jgi:hypothetical protein